MKIKSVYLSRVTLHSVAWVRSNDPGHFNWTILIYHRLMNCTSFVIKNTVQGMSLASLSCALLSIFLLSLVWCGELPNLKEGINQGEIPEYFHPIRVFFPLLSSLCPRHKQLRILDCTHYSHLKDCLQDLYICRIVYLTIKENPWNVAKVRLEQRKLNSQLFYLR